MESSIDHKIANAYSTAVYAEKRQVILAPPTISIFYGFLKAARQEPGLTPETKAQMVMLDAILKDHAKEYRGSMPTVSQYIH